MEERLSRERSVIIRQILPLLAINKKARRRRTGRKTRLAGRGKGTPGFESSASTSTGTTTSTSTRCSSKVAEEESERMEKLRGLIPGGSQLGDHVEVLGETAHYILSLRMQLHALQFLTHAFSTTTPSL